MQAVRRRSTRQKSLGRAGTGYVNNAAGRAALACFSLTWRIGGRDDMSTVPHNRYGYRQAERHGVGFCLDMAETAPARCYSVPRGRIGIEMMGRAKSRGLRPGGIFSGSLNRAGLSPAPCLFPRAP